MTRGEANARRLCLICGVSGARLLRLPDGRNVRACDRCLDEDEHWTSYEEREPIGREVEWKETKTMTTETMQIRIDRAAAGEKVYGNLEIYWDSQDPDNSGPAYRVGAAPQQESGPLEFDGWATNEPGASEADDAGYYLHEYFDGDGRYLGPDQHGVYPTFRMA